MILARRVVVSGLVAAGLLLGSGCAPIVPPDLPKETIAINLRVQIAPEIRAAVEKDLEQLFDEETDTF